MKQRLSIALLACLLLFANSTLTSCKFLRANVSKDQIFHTAKGLTEYGMKKHLFPKADFSKDTLNESGLFDMETIRKITKNLRGARIFLTEKGKISLEKLDFSGYVSWDRFQADTVKITTFRVKIPYKPLYPAPDEKSSHHKNN